MEYEEFLSYISMSIGTIIGNEGRVQLQSIIKNNDVELDALTILSENSNISPTIYLNDYYSEYLDGREASDIVNDILDIYETNSQSIEFDFDFFRDYNKVKNKIVYKLINYESNHKLLADVPYIHFLDLALVFYCIISNDALGCASTLIHTSHLDMWGIDIDTLYENAIVNTPIVLPVRLTSMDTIIKETLLSTLSSQLSDNSEDIDEIANQILDKISSESELPMYVLTNSHKLQGAVCILYSNILKDFSISINSDIYIIPSSIHEVILVPYSRDLSTTQLNEMVNEVNANELETSEVLSDHIYLYERDTDKIVMI